MSLEVMLLVDLGKLVGGEKLAEAEKAVFNAFMDVGTAVCKNAENMECVVFSDNDVITLTIYTTQESFYGAGTAKIKVLHNHTCGDYDTTLQDVIKNVMYTIATALDVSIDKVANAVKRLEIGAIP